MLSRSIPNRSEFKGSNMVITGEDNILESNMFIGGETTASGIHLGGVSSKLSETGTAGNVRFRIYENGWIHRIYKCI